MIAARGWSCSDIQSRLSRLNLCRCAELIPANAILRVAIVEEPGAPTMGLGTSIQRAAEVVGVTDRIQVLNADDAPDVQDLDLIVRAQQTPAQLSPASLAQWRRRFPLARQVIVWGPWCEGGLRNGYFEPGSICVSQLVWPWRFQCFLRQFFSDRPTLWDLPATRTAADRLGTSAIVADDLFCFEPTLEEASQRRLDIVSSSSGVGSALPELCESLGWTIRPWSSVAALLHLPAEERGPIWIWEPEAPSGLFSEIVNTRQQLAGRGIILLGFAEILSHVQCGPSSLELQPALCEHGRTVLLPKPFLVAELQAAVCDLSFQDRRGANRF